MIHNHEGALSIMSAHQVVAQIQILDWKTCLMQRIGNYTICRSSRNESRRQQQRWSPLNYCHNHARQSVDLAWLTRHVAWWPGKQNECHAITQISTEKALRGLSG